MPSSFSISKVILTVIMIVLGSGVVCGFAFATGVRLSPVVGSDATSELEATYSNVAFGFKARVPDDFTANESHLYYGLGPAKEISGVSFRVPTILATDTNLGADSYISVERIGRAACRPSDFFG